MYGDVSEEHLHRRVNCVQNNMGQGRPWLEDEPKANTEFFAVRHVFTVLFHAQFTLRCGVSRFLRNISKNVPGETAPHPRIR